MNRRAHKIDANQPGIVKTLRDCMCVVQVTSHVGNGFPDLVVRTPRRSLFLVEVKDGSLPPSRRQLTEAEQSFSDAFGEHFVVVKSEDEAIALARR